MSTIRTPVAPADLALIADEAERRATPLALRSRWHGRAHWQDVARYAIRFARSSGGDPIVAFLFGVLHDTQRLSEHSDPHHGLRAARVTQRMWDDGWLPIDRGQLQVLTFALDQHDRPGVHPDPTVGACWDADRVTLWRVGVQPDARFMSTRTAWDDPGQARGDLLRGLHDWLQIAREACL